VNIDELVEEIHRISFRGNGIVATVAATPASYPGDKVKGLWLYIDVSKSFHGGNKAPQLIYARRSGLVFYEEKNGEAQSAVASIVRDASPAMPDFDIRIVAQKAYAALRNLLETNSGLQLTEAGSSDLSAVIGYSAIGEMTL